jgi:hypothetical protein
MENGRVRVLANESHCEICKRLSKCRDEKDSEIENQEKLSADDFGCCVLKPKEEVGNGQRR